MHLHGNQKNVAQRTKQAATLGGKHKPWMCPGNAALHGERPV